MANQPGDSGPGSLQLHCVSRWWRSEQRTAVQCLVRRTTVQWHVSSQYSGTSSRHYRWHIQHHCDGRTSEHVRAERLGWSYSHSPDGVLARMAQSRGQAVGDTARGQPSQWSLSMCAAVAQCIGWQSRWFLESAHRWRAISVDGWLDTYHSHDRGHERLSRDGRSQRWHRCNAAVRRSE